MTIADFSIPCKEHKEKSSKTKPTKSTKIIKKQS
jgi:hypothetical protein